MTPQPSPPSYGSSGSPSGSAPTNGSPQRMALDNIIRPELRVSDPSDPNQIAQALLTVINFSDQYATSVTDGSLNRLLKNSIYDAR